MFYFQRLNNNNNKKKDIKLEIYMLLNHNSSVPTLLLSNPSRIKKEEFLKKLFSFIKFYYMN